MKCNSCLSTATVASFNIFNSATAATLSWEKLFRASADCELTRRCKVKVGITAISFALPNAQVCDVLPFHSGLVAVSKVAESSRGRASFSNKEINIK